ncbi:unnamed protein product [Cuscuta epithymum]|uniref:Protein FLUORESCENT IN BLUE LIGHT, chloroplastic-like n=1 Tax=Cuscuta epithymum TaxID=186058 RepID=A0AAV0FFP7_9ASTE|nr:unnamed protein product [Cuscuta epithymum]
MTTIMMQRFLPLNSCPPSLTILNTHILKPIFLTSLEPFEHSPLRRHILADVDRKFANKIPNKSTQWMGIRFKQAMVACRIPTMPLVAANALLLSAPLEAVAETCVPDKSSFNFNMPLLLLVSLIGATVGGLLARQRRGELERVNEQLRQINTALRRQAKIESYAPSLSYAPIGGRIPESELIVDPRKQELISHLKKGKNFLRNQAPEKAFSEFKIALEAAQNLKDPIEEKKAARGLGASLQRQGKYRDAIKYHSLVLEISAREGEDSGNTEAYGAIADCYTELGDLERAGNYYDQYIARLETD